MNNFLNEKYILLIEDNKALRDSLIYALDSHEYIIQTAGHGAEALDFLKNHTHLPFLILLDLMMPIMDGWEFRKHQQANPLLCLIPTIILSAKFDLEKNTSLHANETFLPKPFNVNVLQKMIDNLIKPIN